MSSLKRLKNDNKFTNSSFCKHSHHKQNEFRKKGLFTDVILRGLDGTHFPVHKNIIASQCPYFEALFHSGLKECTEKIIQLDRDISEETFQNILQYIYVGEISITSENAKILNKEAVFFELKGLKNATAKVLEETLNINSSLELWRYADMHFNSDLSGYCLNFIRLNIQTFFEKFLMSVTGEELDKILSNDLLCSEEFLFLNIVNWLKNDFENRTNYFEKLLKRKLFSNLSDEFKETKILSDEILMNNLLITKTLCREVIFKKKDIETVVTSNSIFNVNFYAIANGSISKIELEIIPRLVPIISFKKNKNYAICEYNSNCILISGGVSTNSCINYNYYTKKIEDFPSMIKERQNHCVISLNNKIYACGGEQDDGSMEIMDLVTGTWSVVTSNFMNITDFDVACRGGSIYAFGGIKGTSRKNTNVLRYDPREDLWDAINTESPEMVKPKCLFINDTIYCFQARSHFLNIFDIRTNKWQKTRFWETPSFHQYDVFEHNQHLHFFGESFRRKYPGLVIVFDLEIKSFSKYMIYDMSSYRGGRINVIKP